MKPEFRDCVAMGARAYHRNVEAGAEDEMVATHQEMAAALGVCAFLDQLDVDELDSLQDYINLKTQNNQTQ